MSLVHLHLLLNHIPVVGALFLVALFAAAVLRGNATLLRTALWTGAVLAVIAGAAFLTGEPAEEAVEGLATVSEPALERHEDVAKLATILFVTAGAACAGALLLLRRRRDLPGWIGSAGLVGSLVLAIAMGVTANLGGQIRHSEIRAGEVTASSDGARDADEDDDDR